MSPSSVGLGARHFGVFRDLRCFNPSAREPSQNGGNQIDQRSGGVVCKASEPPPDLLDGEVAEIRLEFHETFRGFHPNVLDIGDVLGPDLIGNIESGDILV